MPFPSALNSTQLDYLRGTSVLPPSYAADQYLILNSNTVVFAARVNQASFGSSFAQVTFDGVTTGAYTDALPGMTVLISHTNDARAAFFAGRVRKAATSSILYINETSAAIADNDYITVIRDFGRLAPKLARDTGSAYLKDWDVTYTAPAPLIYNLQAVYAGVVSGSPSGYTVSFAPLAAAVTDGASISSWAWTVPSGSTITAGSDSTQNITVRFDASTTEYWVRLVVTDSGSRTATRWLMVKAIPTDFSGVIPYFDGASIDGNIDSGWNATITAFSGVSSVLDETLVAIVEIERYNGTETAITSNVKFVGRLLQEQSNTQADDTYSRLQDVEYTLEGVGDQLARIPAPPIYMRDKPTPAVWDEIKALTLWRAMWYMLSHNTFHDLYSLSFDSTGTDFRAPQIELQSTNLLDAVSELAENITATVEYAPTGGVRVHRNANYLGTSARNALPTIIAFDERDWLSLSLELEHVDQIGAASAGGGCYNTSSKNTLVLLSNAPKVAQGDADGIATMVGQILTANASKTAAKTELEERVGHHYAYSNPTPILKVDFPDGYNWLVPSNSQWYTFTVAAGDNTAGRAFTTANRWLCQSVSISHDNNTGSKTVSAEFRAETVGTPGTAYEPPAESTTLPSFPPIPALPPFPALGTPPSILLPPGAGLDDLPPWWGANPDPFSTNIPTNGDVALLATNAMVAIARGYAASDTPTYYEITPPVEDVIVHALFAPTGRGAYVLTQGEPGSWCCEFDFANGQEGWSAGDFTGATPGVAAEYDSGNGYWERYQGINGNIRYEIAIIEKAFSFSGLLTRIEMDLSTTFGGINQGILYKTTTGSFANYSGFTIQTVPGGTSTIVVDLSSSPIPVNTGLTIGISNDTVLSGSFQNMNAGIRRLRLYGTGDNPFPDNDCGTSTLATTRVWYTADAFRREPTWVRGAALLRDSLSVLRVASASGRIYAYTPDAYTQFSIDNALSFALPEAVGSSPGAFGGVDTQKVGTVILAGADEQVYLATAGGAYAAYGDPMPTGAQPSCIYVPYYQLNSTTVKNTGSTPQFFVASDTLTASDEALWAVSGAGTIFANRTPQIGSDYGAAVSSNCLAVPWFSATRIAAILDFDGTRHLVTSLDAGATWTDRGALTGGADYVRYRKGDKLFQQLYIADGDPAFSPDNGANIYARPNPDPLGNPIVSIEPY